VAKPIISPAPLQYAAGYTLDLYCKYKHDGSHPTAPYSTGFGQFHGQSKAGCLRRAKRAGWRVNNKSRLSTCPACVAALTQQGDDRG